MLGQFLVGSIASGCNIAIHALIMTAVVQVAHLMSIRETRHPSLRLTTVMMSTVLVLMAAHTSEVIVWALVYRIVDAVPPQAGLIYFAFVNYTTLGYGDIVPVENWQLLGPMTAMNGVLLFGWSTAVIFDVLRRTMAQNAPALGG